MMKTDWDLLGKNFQKEYEKLESDIELHRISFILTKKCACKTTDCRHYQKEKRFLFEIRMDKLLSYGILISAAADFSFKCIGNQI